MIALALDDEYLMLERLARAVFASPDIDEVYKFSNCAAALEWLAGNQVDIAFLDINMRGITGLEMAQRISSLQPDCKIVFCTGYSEHALDAFKVHASGYLMKPITESDVQAEIDHIKQVKRSDKALTVKCFGDFQVLHNGAPVHFKRSKTLELFAYLVDRDGAGVSAKQICAVLWEDDQAETKHMNYFWQLLDDLRRTLKELDADQVLLKVGSRYALDMDKLDCDYHSYLNTGAPPFRGEYMTQYSWAEDTTGFLFE